MNILRAPTLRLSLVRKHSTTGTCTALAPVMATVLSTSTSLQAVLVLVLRPAAFRSALRKAKICGTLYVYFHVTAKQDTVLYKVPIMATKDDVAEEQHRPFPERVRMLFLLPRVTKNYATPCF